MLHSIQTGTCRHTCIDTNTYKYWINRIYVLPVHEPVHVLIGTPWGENLPATNGLHLHMDEHIPSSIHSSMVRSFVHYSATQWLIELTPRSLPSAPLSKPLSATGRFPPGRFPCHGFFRNTARYPAIQDHIASGVGESGSTGKCLEKKLRTCQSRHVFDETQKGACGGHKAGAHSHGQTCSCVRILCVCRATLATTKSQTTPTWGCHRAGCLMHIGNELLGGKSLPCTFPSNMLLRQAIKCVSSWPVAEGGCSNQTIPMPPRTCHATRELRLLTSRDVMVTNKATRSRIPAQTSILAIAVAPRWFKTWLSNWGRAELTSWPAVMQSCGSIQPRRSVR